MFLCICRGVYDIVVKKDGVGCCVGQYNNKGSFGELALMYNTPRAATIIATEDGALWGLVSVWESMPYPVDKVLYNSTALWSEHWMTAASLSQCFHSNYEMTIIVIEA